MTAIYEWAFTIFASVAVIALATLLVGMLCDYIWRRLQDIFSFPEMVAALFYWRARKCGPTPDSELATLLEEADIYVSDQHLAGRIRAALARAAPKDSGGSPD